VGFGSKTGDRDGADSTPEAHAPVNVVRLPRDWLGPREELVPFGPEDRARAREARAAGGLVAAPSSPAGEVPTADLYADTPPAATDFWSEDSAALHDAIQGPGAQSLPDSAQAPVAVPGLARREQPRAGTVRLRVRRRWIGTVGAATAVTAVASLLWASNASHNGPNALRSAASRSAQAHHDGHGRNADLASEARATAPPASRRGHPSGRLRSRSKRRRHAASIRPSAAVTTSRHRPPTAATHPTAQDSAAGTGSDVGGSGQAGEASQDERPTGPSSSGASTVGASGDAPSASASSGSASSGSASSASGSAPSGVEPASSSGGGGSSSAGSYSPVRTGPSPCYLGQLGCQ